MDQISNSFSLLGLDPEVSEEQGPTATTAASICEDSYKRKQKGLDDGKLPEKENDDRQTPETPLGHYRMKGLDDGKLPLKENDDRQTPETPLGDYRMKGLDDGKLPEKVNDDRQTSETPLGDYRMKGLDDGKLLEKENDDRQTPETPLRDYRMPLVWIDLEMTGLNIEVDRIIEIACVITDGNLTKSVEGPDLVINQPKECLDKMGEWCQEHHGESGLTEKVLRSTISEKEAENQVIEFVKKHIDMSTHSPLIAGNSVYMDLLFLRKYMPDLAALLSHVIVDVSSVKALCLRWYPRERKKAPQKENKHRAMDDIKESIAELKFYKEHIFKPKSRK